MDASHSGYYTTYNEDLFKYCFNKLNGFEDTDRFKKKARYIRLFNIHRIKISEINKDKTCKMKYMSYTPETSSLVILSKHECWLFDHKRVLLDEFKDLVDLLY